MNDEKKEEEVLDDKDFGLHPSELDDEIEVSRKKESGVPKREKDVKVQVKELPEPEEKEEEAKPSMITIQKSEKLKQAIEKKRCPFDAKLDCRNCRMSQVFLGTETNETCSIVRIAHRMPL